MVADAPITASEFGRNLAETTTQLLELIGYKLDRVTLGVRCWAHNSADLLPGWLVRLLQARTARRRRSGLRSIPQRAR
jgi:hypothetical protein